MSKTPSFALIQNHKKITVLNVPIDMVKDSKREDNNLWTEW
jgi:hypothetical protein